MFKVVLINPPTIVRKEDVENLVRIPQPNGLAYIAAVLERNGYLVKIIDALAFGHRIHNLDKDGFMHIGLSFETILNEIAVFKPDLIGVSIISTALKHNSFELIKLVKRNFSKIKIIVGGAHPTVDPEDCLKQNGIDYVCIGEGEFLLLELVKALDENVDESNLNIDGLCYKLNEKIVIGKRREAFKEIDLIPFPARHLLPMNEYYMASKKLMSMFSMSTYNKRWASVSTSRGCTYKCTFCSIYLTAGRMWRARSPENVVDECEELINKYKIKHIAFVDDNMTLNRDRMHRILNLIEEKKLKFEWSTPNGIRADSLSKDLLKKMKMLGCKRICIAPESGNQEVVRKIIKKNLDLAHVENAVKWAKEVGLAIDCFFVIGFIDETIENVRDSIRFGKKLKKLGASGILVSLATPFPGTEFYEKSLLEKRLDVNQYSKLSIFEDTPCVKLKYIDRDELIRLKKEFVKEMSGVPWDYLGLLLRILLYDPVRFFRLLIKNLR